MSPRKMPFTIRPATMDDYERISNILEESDAIHYAAEPDYFKPPSESRRSRSYMEQVLSSEDSTILVAEEHGDVVGVLFLFIRTPPEASIFRHRRFVVIETIAVEESWRSLGIGSALLAKAESWAKAKGVKHLELSVWEFNQRALALYEKTGYRTVRHTMGKEL